MLVVLCFSSVSLEKLLVSGDIEGALDMSRMEPVEALMALIHAVFQLQMILCS